MQQSLLHELTTSITPQLIGHAAHLLHESPANTGKAIAAALPILLSGASVLTGTQSGLTALANLSGNSANDGKLLHQLPALYQGRLDGTPMAVLGKQLLAASFGSRAQDAAKELASVSGLKPASSERLLGILSPHVLSVLGDHQRSSGAKGAAGLASLLAASSGTTAASGAARATAAIVGKGGRIAKAARPAKAGWGLWGWDWKTLAPVGVIALMGLMGWLLAFKTDGPVPVAVAPAAPKVAAAAPPAAEIKAEVKSAEVKAEVKAAAPAAQPVAPAVIEVAKTAAAVVPGVTSFYGSTPSPAEAAAQLNPDYVPAKAVVAAAAAPVEVPVAAPVAAPVPGITSFYGSGPSPAEAAAQLNPDYVPAKAVVAEAAAPVAAPVAGITSFYGSTPSPADAAAQLNPDYVPAIPVVVEVAAPVAAPVPGVTSFYGSTPSPAEAAAQFNPDYVAPAPVVVAVAPEPARAPVALKPVAEAPKPAPVPGVTTFFGMTRTPAEAEARANPDYKPRSVAAVAPVAAPVTIQSCQDSVTAAVKSGPILFENAKATLTSASVSTLDRVAAAFKACPAARLQVNGHTDNSGSADMNQDLSERRAESVVEYLTSKGVDGDVLGSAGFGLTQPIAPNDSAANKALNRRIEFIVGKK